MRTVRTSASTYCARRRVLLPKKKTNAHKPCACPVQRYLPRPHTDHAKTCAVTRCLNRVGSSFVIGQDPGGNRVAAGCEWYGPIHVLNDSASDIGLQARSRPGLPELHIFADPIQQHFQTTVLDAWTSKVTQELCRRRGLKEGPY